MPGMCGELISLFYFALFKMELVVWRLVDSTAQAQAEAPHFLVFGVTWGARAHTGDTPQILLVGLLEA